MTEGARRFSTSRPFSLGARVPRSPVRTRARLSTVNPLISLVHKTLAKVAELADAPDLGSGAERHGGSSPPFRIIPEIMNDECGMTNERQAGLHSSLIIPRSSFSLREADTCL